MPEENNEIPTIVVAFAVVTLFGGILAGITNNTAILVGTIVIDVALLLGALLWNTIK